MTYPNSLDTPSEPRDLAPAPESTSEAAEASFGEILSQFEQQHRQDEHVQGTVVTISDDSVRSGKLGRTIVSWGGLYTMAVPLPLCRAAER